MKKVKALFVVMIVLVSVFGFNSKVAYAATKIETIDVKITRKVSAFSEIKVSANGLTIGTPTWNCTKAQLLKKNAGDRVTVTFPVTVKSGYSFGMPVKYNVTGSGASNYSISLSMSNGKGTLKVTVPVYKQLSKPKVTFEKLTLPKWKKVSGASSYTVNLYNADTGKKIMTKKTTSTSIDLSKYVSQGSYILKVRANSGKTYVLNSGYAENYIVIYKVYY